jgi:CDP-glucose 4,6-dehydratase
MDMNIDKKFWKNKKVFITGHTGFKGAWLSFILSNLGSKVKGYSLKPENKSLYKEILLHKKIESNYSNIKNYRKLYKSINDFKPEILFHLAAQPLVLESYKDPLETFETNVKGTLNVMECVKNISGIKSIIIITTDKCYQNNEDKREYKESDTLGGKDPYSWSKVCAEYITNYYINNIFIKTTKRCATVRAGNVIGPGDYGENRIIPDIIKAINSNNTINIRNPKSIRPWQNILDALSGYMILANKLYNNGSFIGPWNFGPSKEKMINVETITKKLINISNYKKTYAVKKKKDEKEEFKYLKLNSNKALNRLKWKTKITIDQSINQIINWNNQKKLNNKKINIANQMIDDYFK